MKKRILGMVLILSMLMAVVPIMASAAENGTCGENVTWELDDNGTLTISGTGDMYDYEFDQSPFFYRYQRIKNIIVEEGVTNIGASMFCSCYYLKTVRLPYGITSIGDDVFYGCKILANIEIPTSVTSIGNSAFRGCESISSVVIPDSVIRLGDSAFYGCENLKEIKISDSITKIGKYTFWGCSQLTSIMIPESIISIDEDAFPVTFPAILSSILVDENNKNYSSVDNVLFNKNQTELIQYPIGKTETDYIIPDTVTAIGPSAFRSCNLKKVTIPNSVTSIGEMAFDGCKDFTNITIPDSVVDLGKRALSGCSNLTNVIISKNVTSLDSTFLSCRNLRDVIIPNGVNSLSAAFLGCENIANIHIPDSVTHIGALTFSGCASLSSIAISNSVISIGQNSFEDCTNLTDIYYSGTEEMWDTIEIDYKGDGNNILNNATIHYNYTCTTPDTYEIGEITPSETGVTLTVQTKETVSGKQTVVVACYDGNGSFIGAKTRQITASDVVQNISIDIDKSKTSSVKAFIWNDIGYMMPASRMQSLEL